MRKVFLGITGASGALYGLKTAEELSRRDDTELHVCVTPDGYTNIRLETGEDASEEWLKNRFDAEIYDYRDFAASVSSGSFKVDHYVIAPASMGSVGRIASGVSSNLIERCADVAMKERRDLVVMFRETPLNDIHLENLLKLSRAGAVVMPAAPGFYHNPQNLDDLASFMTGKLFDILNIEHELFDRWEG
ncbi:UbiX family flavin prenyltransferase [Limisalsivibrio acetivorans]|uniref:UbiX family flavin prenyltransferase n=1 Tax=Limisalsivibrio acetivorans TaxID=1304888 RepID=UPI0003B7A0A2|nr:UbiX family flavin prenyltransferase [Limisalsivibrio acetivorans]